MHAAGRAVEPGFCDRRRFETAAALRKFLLWAISLVGGNAPKYLDAVGFIPLPDFIRGLSEHQINLIK